MQITVPYGHGTQSATIDEKHIVSFIDPHQIPAAENVKADIAFTLDNLLGDMNWESFRDVKSVGIAINDKTRPVPHELLLPPLMERLSAMGIPKEQITFYIACGTHEAMTEEEYSTILTPDLKDTYQVVSHSASHKDDLVALGSTSAGTLILVNAGYFDSDLKIVVGNIEPHQFAGFSGGVKTAAIGLAGVETINHNHSLLNRPFAFMGEYERNPVRQDIEEIGSRIGIHLAVNVVLNQDKQIVHVLAGDPRVVMEKGVILSRQVCQVTAPEFFDVVISSPGGHPKDINVYQAQKALAHAALITKKGGVIILVAACPEGSGSQHYQQWVVGRKSNEEVMADFMNGDFRVGPHKAFLIARDALRHRLMFCSEMEKELAESLLLNPVADLQTALNLVLNESPHPLKVGIMNHASVTIPKVGANG